MKRFSPHPSSLFTVTVVCLYLLVASMVGSPLMAQRLQSYDFTDLNSSTIGLSHNYATCLEQDDRGFVWIGTTNGLNRYDGSVVRSFYKDEMGIDSSLITALWADDRGNVWVGTDSGVTIYNFHTDNFHNFDMVSDKKTIIRNRVSQINSDEHGVIWFVVDSQGVFAFDQVADTLVNYFVDGDKVVIPANVNSLSHDKDGRVWLSLAHSNLYYTDNMNNLEPVTDSEGGQPFLGENIIKVIVSPYNTIYVTSVGNGVCEYDIATRNVKTLIPSDGYGFTPTAMLFDKNRVLWVTTKRGVWAYDTTGGQAIHIMNDANDKFSLSDNRTLAILVDDSQGLWVATDTGLNYSGIFYRNFDKINTVGGISLNGSYISGFVDDGNGTIWITSQTLGLLTYSIESGLLERYVHPELPNDLLGVCWDNGALWFSHAEAIYRLDTLTLRIRSYSHTSTGLGLGENRVIYKNPRDGVILVGTKSGLFRYDQAVDDFLPIDVFNGFFVDNIICDSRGDLWVSTYSNGIIRYNMVSGKLTNYTHDKNDIESLPANRVLSVFEDSVGRIWISTFGEGIALWDERSEKFVTYNSRVLGDQFLNDICSEIVQDDSGDLWISTNKGLVRFSPQTGSVRGYTTADGLLNNEFNSHNSGCFKTPDGNIFFGSYDGFIKFNPRNFHTDATVPRIFITDLYVNGRVVSTGDHDSPLSRNIDEERRLSLSARQNSFGFGFSLLGFDSPASNMIYCRLDGFEDEWRRVSLSNTTFYTNIKAGRYTLHVKGVNGNGLWNEQHPGIEIVVAKHFFKSVRAMIIYVAALLLVIFFTSRWFYRRSMKRDKIMRDAEIFNERMTFFSNVIHEIKTPLTLIRTPLYNIIGSNPQNEELKDDLSVMSGSVDYLTRLVNELLDFVRIERRGYVIECQAIDIVEKMRTLCFNYNDTARHKGIELTLNCQDDRIIVNADEGALNKIFNNLLFNAVKYAQSWIKVSVSRQDDSVVLSFANDGNVIPHEWREKIFKPFVRYQGETRNVTEGVGIGLPLARTLSEMLSGSLIIADNANYTDFILTLPVIAINESVEQVLPDGLIEIEGDNDKPTLLLAEDNHELRSYIEKHLRKEYYVISVSDGAKALKVLNSHNVDLVLTDLAMPGMNGLELCRTIRQDFENSHMLVVVLTGHNTPEMKIMSMEHGANLYIEKPFEMEYLKACLKSMTERRELMRRTYRNAIATDYSMDYDLPRRDKDFLVKLDSVILSNISDPAISNEQLAETMNMSVSTFIRKMKKLLGTTPNNYLRTKRLVMAAHMFEKGHNHISEVCYSVGFGDASYFTKCFREQYGMPPVDYIKASTDKQNTGFL